VSAGPAALLQAAVESGGVPGAVFLLGNAEGVIAEIAAGKRAQGSDVAMTTDTVFWLASMTKPVVSAAAMQLVERGELVIDAPIAPVLPELAAPAVLEGFDDHGRPRLRPARRPITLRHLLTHTSGFAYDFGNADILRYVRDKKLPRGASGQLAALDLPLVFDPGERWEYGISTDWLGRAVEAASGERLDAYIAENITGPLGMNDTGFGLDANRAARVAGMHSRGADGTLAVIPFAPPPAPEFHAGGHGLYATPRDYLRFTRALLRGGELDGARILKAETVARMAENQIGDLKAGIVRSVIPEMALEIQPPPGIDFGWGFGFLINRQPLPTGRGAGSLSWSGVANTYFWIDPGQNLTGVMMTQIMPFGDPAAFNLAVGCEVAAYQARAARR
jgi:CubicO group peptidase (beta-lactamase class C family)